MRRAFEVAVLASRGADAAVAAVNHQVHAASLRLADTGARRLSLGAIAALGGGEGAHDPTAGGDATEDMHLGWGTARHDAFSSAITGSAGAGSGEAVGPGGTGAAGTAADASGAGAGAFAGPALWPSMRRAADGRWLALEEPSSNARLANDAGLADLAA